MHIRLAHGTTLTTVEGKDVLFSVKTGDSYGLNETAARMVRLACENDQANTLDRLAEEYGAERSELESDLAILIHELVRLKFVQLAPATADKTPRL